MSRILDILDRGPVVPVLVVEKGPTGGITRERAPEYLELDNVVCVGGSWVAPRALIERGDWTGIERLAREAAALPRRGCRFKSAL